MAGITNSWIEQYTAPETTPCINDNKDAGSFSNCILWLVVGLVLGSLTFSKKGTTQQ